jgi:hypothetical protein
MPSAIRLGPVLLLAALASGCTSFAPAPAVQPALQSACRTAASCDYNGPYDPGERAYAEQEAARLNNAEAARLRNVR